MTTTRVLEEILFVFPDRASNERFTIVARSRH